ncbi:hypothetical protein MNEG_11962 [Monoraphidium neglectum]|uniref:Uncharacterized protein n=1 Tax=Monoraphidium neglectum TaxID=145388 RepID=A0A0D2M3V9_9CHLO|nr:hypothetical protein MNEG_11962 [Monoraphidium neglectum]KIY96001.1 hypothetical protein MNEG_11962 [Monoraphidium neglectum]|eukprot:XP_013895021.1 hypothetical protein MNEG_11962 [Monoraphidium neglectum]
MSSKRQRKHKELGSLKTKQHAPQIDALDLLGEVDELGDDGLNGSNALILTAQPKGGKAAAKQARAQEQQQRALSKAEQRKLKQVQLKKERRDGLEQVFTQLQQSSVADDRLQLLRPLHMRGARETKKQRLRRALKLQRAGVETEAAAELLVERRRPRGSSGGGGDSSSGSEGSDDEESDEEAGRSARFGAKGGAAQPPVADEGERVERAEQQQQGQCEVPAKRQRVDAGQQQRQQKEQQPAQRPAAQPVEGASDEEGPAAAAHQEKGEDGSMA